MGILSSTKVFGNLYVDNDIFSLGNIEGSNIKVNGNNVYHTGNKPSLSELGAAPSSHSHNYLPLTGGILTGNTTIESSSPIFTIKSPNGGNTEMIFDRGSYANWKMTVVSGTMHMQTDYFGGSKGNYESILKLHHDSGNIYTKGDLYAQTDKKVYHQGFKPTTAELNVYSKTESDNKYINKSVSSEKTLNAGWYIIAKCNGGRASAKFSVRECMSGQHSTTHFYAAHHYGNGNVINVLSNSSYAGGGAIRNIRIWGNSTYDGAYLEVYIDTSATTGCYFEITDNVQREKWQLVDWEPHRDALPGEGTPVGSQKTIVNLDNTTGFISTDNIFVGDSKVYHQGFKPTASDINMATLTRGNYLTGGNFNGVSAQTWGVDATTTSTANKIAARDGSGDINTRLFRSEYGNQSDISGAIAFRVSNSGDNYIRFCSNTAAIRTFLDTYSKTEANNAFRSKTDGVFNTNIEIITPAS